MSENQTETKELEQAIVVTHDKAKNLIIRDAGTYELASEGLLEIKARMKRVDEIFDPVVKKTHEAWKEARARKSEVEKPLKEAESILKPKIAAYIREQEEDRRKEEARLAEIAKREEEDRQIERAAELEADGDKDGAEYVASKPVEAPVIKLEDDTKKKGISMRVTYSAEVFDFDKLLVAATTEKSYRALVQPDTKALNQLARAMKENLSVPGVKLVKKETIAAGAR